MATKRRKKTHRRRRSLSAAPLVASHRRRRRRSPLSAHRKRRRRSMSSMTGAGLTAVIKEIVYASAGGALAAGGNKAMSGLGVLPRTGINLGVGYVLAKVAGWKNISAGFIGGNAALELQPTVNKMLSEMGVGNKYADNKSANQLPLTLNDGNQTLTLMEDTSSGTYYYMGENGALTLAESIYPQYSPLY